MMNDVLEIDYSVTRLRNMEFYQSSKRFRITKFIIWNDSKEPGTVTVNMDDTELMHCQIVPRDEINAPLSQVVEPGVKVWVRCNAGTKVDVLMSTGTDAWMNSVTERIERDRREYAILDRNRLFDAKAVRKMFGATV
jgi:hypothetical protein